MMLEAGPSVPVSIIGLLLFTLKAVLAFDNTRNDNLAVYYGQNSNGSQDRLSTYCQDDTIDVFPLAFVTNFQGQGGLPSLDLSITCSGADGLLNGTSLPNCQFLAKDIKSCQDRGKIITISLGGATGSVVFTSPADATTAAKNLWDVFFGGTSSTRPFGTAVLDGVDLDIEGGSTAHYDTFLGELQSLFRGGGKRYYTTAAPQCPFPDAYMGSILNSVPFDAVYVQFYNNYCSLPTFTKDPKSWNFDQWDNWAKGSINKEVKVYIGAPAAPKAANPAHYVDVNTLGEIAIETRKKYTSFGGVMLWDASQAYANHRYDQGIKRLLTGGSPPPSTTTTEEPPSTTNTTNLPSGSLSTTTREPPTTTTPSSSSSGHLSITRKPSSGTSTLPVPTPPQPSTVSCIGVKDWVENTVYIGGDQVKYKAHLWTAKWWSNNSVPTESAEEWKDNGPCSSRVAASFQKQNKFCVLNANAR